MSDEKDRWGDKLREVERAREDQWAYEQDQLLIKKMREKQATELQCPRCGKPLVARANAGIAWMACPMNHGGWVDGETLETILEARK
jgi:ribosomal protein L37AE/L43A